jgi:hypothetical protein
MSILSHGIVPAAGYQEGSTGLIVGMSASASTDMEYINMASLGNSTAFGDISDANHYSASSTSNGSSARYISFHTKHDDSSDVINYGNILTPGNSADFGNHQGNTASHPGGAASNSTNNRAVYMGRSSNSTVIDYVAINTLGNASNFGSLSTGSWGGNATGNATNERAIYISGRNAS